MNFDVETTYPLEIFENNDQICTWATIKVGWDLKRIATNEIQQFAINYLVDHKDMVNEYITELICGVQGVQKDEVKKLIRKIFSSLSLEYPSKESFLWKREWLKWRYCILSEMMKNIKNEEDLLYKIEGLYADFGYPDDMESFIYYMPLDKEITLLDTVDARKLLIERAKNFLEKEKINITKDWPDFPLQGISSFL